MFGKSNKLNSTYRLKYIIGGAIMNNCLTATGNLRVFGSCQEKKQDPNIILIYVGA